MKVFLKAVIAIVLIILILAGAFFGNYFIKANRSTETVGKAETKYTADETGTFITNIPYDEYIEKCDAGADYIVPEISESNSGEENSIAINNAVAEASLNGGATVFIPQGKYKVSTIELKSNVTLFVSEQAELVSLDCDENKSASSPLKGAVVTADGAENITITGGGIISVQYRDTGENLSVLKPVLELSANGYPEIVRVSHKYFINHNFSGYWDLPCYGIFIRHADVDYSEYSCTPRQCNTREFAYIKN